jgi:hypothetical protein
MAMGNWVRMSVEGLGTSGRRGALAFVPGLPAVRPGVSTRTTSRVAQTPGVASSRNLLSPVQLQFTPNLSTEVDQMSYRKVVDLKTPYNFYKGRLGFCSTDYSGHAVEHGRKLDSSE